MTGVTVHRRASCLEVNAEYADGVPLSIDAREEAIALRWRGQAGHTNLFLVGTKREAELLRRETTKANAAQTHSPSDEQGGRRGQRKRGGDTSASTSEGSW